MKIHAQTYIHIPFIKMGRVGKKSIVMIYIIIVDDKCTLGIGVAEEEFAN